MKLNGRSTHDDDIVIGVRKAVDAYEQFKKMRGRRSNGDGADDGGPAFEFDKAIRSQLQILQATFPNAGMILGSKQTFSKWKTDPPREQIKRKRSVLLAVLSISGVEISSHGILARQPVNLSPLAELSSLKSRKLTNDPEEVEEVTFEVELSSLLFKSAEMKVMSDWIVKADRKTEKGVPVEIGSVVYGLTEADVEIDFGETRPVNWTRRISPDTDPSLGRTDGCIAIWSEIRSAWIVQPLEGSPMRVRLEGVKLCTTRGKRGSFIDVKVTATEEKVDSDFRMRRLSRSCRRRTRSRKRAAFQHRAGS